MTLLTLLLCLGCTTRSPAIERPTTPDALLRDALANAARGADGVVAVTVVHLSSGVRASVHGDVRLPMMSVFKLPLSVVALSRIDEGSLRLDQSIAIEESELRPGVSPIADAWAKGEHTFSLETVLRRTLQQSDNTGGDKLVSMLGEAAATKRLRALGMPGIDIAEQEIEIFARVHCPGIAPPANGWTFPAIGACPKPEPAVSVRAAQHEIEASPNAATSDALADMLVALERGRALKPASRAWLSDTLAGTTTGAARLRAGVPPGTRVEHKTGTGDTIEGRNIATNDAGVITLPNGERFVIVVLTAGSRRDAAAREGVIASLARAAFRHHTHAE